MRYIYHFNPADADVTLVDDDQEYSPLTEQGHDWYYIRGFDRIINIQEDALGQGDVFEMNVDAMRGYIEEKLADGWRVAAATDKGKHALTIWNIPFEED